ncbi:MAG: hypothetical protein JST00_10000 [Deltaproteobacteria bacterium]|nr:hypothetical protein [Deltaproteobacteria bacterium]
MRIHRLVLGALGLGTLLAPIEAGADPSHIRPEAVGEHPLHRLVAREQGPSRFLAEAIQHTFAADRVVRPPGFGDGNSPLDCEHASHDIRFDPRSGDTVATLDLRVRAKKGPLSRIGLSLDQGLAIGAVTVDDGRTATVTDKIYKPARLVEIKLSPPLEPGQTAVVHVPYQGTLECGAYPEGGGVVCTKGEDFSYFAHQSIVPYVFDPLDPTGGSDLDAMTRNIVLRVPSATDVIATGEKVSETTSGDTKVSTWAIDRPLSRTLGMYVFAGRLGQRTVPGRAVPTTFVFPNPEMPVDKRLVSWSTPALDFVEKVGGQLLPFQRSMTLVRLPATVGDPGTATFGMTLLSETYQRTGDLMHEETWAHENSHLFWGIVVPESTSFESRMMTEGLATLSEIDYTYGRHYASEDRDTYLARRFVPIGIDLRVQGKQLPAIQLVNGESPPDGYRSSQYTLWAYYKTSATLDHLRATLGDAAFERGLGEYVKRCSYVGCSPSDLRAVLESSTGRDLGPFWARWVTASGRPRIDIGFEPVAGGADLEITKGDDAPMTLELFLELDDGQLVKRHVDLGGKVTRLHVGTGAWVRTVRTSPRHDNMIEARSAVDLDLDFDGETDGIDLLRCTPLVGKKYASEKAIGLWDVEERFDPRCDVNGDLQIDDADLMAIAERYGNLRGGR